LKKLAVLGVLFIKTRELVTIKAANSSRSQPDPSRSLGLMPLYIVCFTSLRPEKESEYSELPG